MDSTNSREPIAIVGIGCRLPGGGHDVDSLWQLLVDGVDAIIDVPPDRWDIRKFHDPDPEAPGKMYTRQAGFLQAPIYDFDPRFFGISPREASVMDPQQRLMLEVTWEAFEDAGFVPGATPGERVGVYVGAFCFDVSVHA